MLVKYIYVTPPLDWEGNEIPINYESYNITVKGMIYYDYEKHEYIFKIGCPDEQTLEKFINDHSSFVRYATDKEVIDCFRQQKLDEFEVYHRAYLARDYPPERQISFLTFVNLYPNNQQIVSLVNQVRHYIFEVIMPYYYSICNKIKTCNSLEEWNNIIWDYDQFEQYNPKLRVETLIRIVSSGG